MKKGLFESLYQSLGERFSRQLFEQVAGAKSLTPTWTVSKVLALIMAALVNALTPLLAILGIVLIWQNWFNLILVPLGGLCLVIAWQLRPRFGARPDVVARSQAPHLYQLADDIAHSLHARPVNGVVVDESFNASFGWSGWNKTVLTIGLPLLSVLDEQERVALISHELAHSVNGDVGRGIFVGTAVHSLAWWYSMLFPGTAAEGDIIYLAAQLVMGLLSWLPWVGGYTLAHLLWRDSQRAEYLADYQASTVSGTQAMLCVLKKLELEPQFAWFVHRAAVACDVSNIFDELARYRERGENTGVESPSQERGRLDATHPPTDFRIEFLKKHPASARLSLSRFDSEAIDRELAPLQRGFQAKLVDHYLRTRSV